MVARLESKAGHLVIGDFKVSDGEIPSSDFPRLLLSIPNLILEVLMPYCSEDISIRLDSVASHQSSEFSTPCSHQLGHVANKHRYATK